MDKMEFEEKSDGKMDEAPRKNTSNHPKTGRRIPGCLKEMHTYDMVNVGRHPTGAGERLGKETWKMKHKWMVWPLALGLALTLAACKGSDPKEALVGTWSAQVDVMEQVVEGMRLTAPEIADELEMESFNIPLVMEFREDDTYTLSVNQEQLDQTMDELIQKAVDATMAYMEQTLKEQGITNMTVDEALAQSGMDRDSFTDLMKQSMGTLSTTMAQQIQTEGQYRVDEEKLYTSNSTDLKPADSEATPYTLDKDSLTMDFSDVEMGEVTFTRGG